MHSNELGMLSKDIVDILAKQEKQVFNNQLSSPSIFIFRICLINDTYFKYEYAGKFSHQIQKRKKKNTRSAKEKRREQNRMGKYFINVQYENLELIQFSNSSYLSCPGMTL